MGSDPEIQSQEQSGATPTERRLAELSRKSFLSLWSYPRVFRNQGRLFGRGDGKEVADLLVVFENHIIVFSIKECGFKDSRNLHQDWCRWYRAAIGESAPQIWAAERWIKEHPERLYLDRACTDPFPLEVPNTKEAKFHRVLVAHGAAERCRRELGGSGALKIVPDISGSQHLFHPDQGGLPFAVGKIDRTRGFVHVLDDISLDILMRELDTITDFIGYFSSKEELIENGRLRSAASEADLLADYLFPREGKIASGFSKPRDGSSLEIADNVWRQFDRDPYRLRKRADDRVSYLWDQLIEEHTRSLVSGTSYVSNSPVLQTGERVLRVLAREPRWHRRHLATALVDFVVSTERLPRDRFSRVIEPLKPGEPFFAFQLLARDGPWPTEDHYREVRRNQLAHLVEVVRLRYPQAADIVGIATATGKDAFTSQDICWSDGRLFTEEDLANVEAIAAKSGFLTNVARSEYTYFEYPNPRSPSLQLLFGLPGKPMKGRERNSPCPCNSGRKYKHCCGRAAKR